MEKIFNSKILGYFLLYKHDYLIYMYILKLKILRKVIKNKMLHKC
jgi:hypothetical protein